MNYPLLHIPDDHEQLVPWLEEQLRGDDLAALAAELSAVHGEPRQPRSLADVLGERRNDVLQQGLGVLEPSRVTVLLEQPTLLWELSELILIEGGSYSDQEPPTELQQRIDAGWNRLENELHPTRREASEASPRPVSSPTPPPREKSPWRSVVAVIAVAAIVGIAVWLGRPEPAPPPGWGFNAPGALAVDMEPAEYLQHLARSASVWYNKTPDSPEALRERLEQFRAGCETLLAAEHSQLADADKEWLLKSCREWIEKIDAHLADISAGDKPFETLQTEANETIDRMIETLTDRSGQA